MASKGAAVSHGLPGSSLLEFLRPRAIAIVGASADPDALAGKPIRYLIRHGYTGRILPVNPRHSALFGLPCYPSLGQAPGPIDLVIVAVRASLAVGVLQEAAACKIPYAIVIGSGFAETGSQGAARERDLVRAARTGGIRLLGPNTQGFVNVPDHVAATFSEVAEGPPQELRSGPLALVSQSGAFGFSALALAQDRKIGVRYTVATGNEADLTVADWILAYLEDPEVCVISAYLEGVRDAVALEEAAARAAQVGVPLCLIRGGATAPGARAARWHTAAPRTGARLFAHLSSAYGVTLAADLEEVFDLASLVGRAGLPRRSRAGSGSGSATPPGVAIVSISGGAGVLAADALGSVGIRVPSYEAATRRALADLIPSYGSTGNPTDVTAQVLENVERFEDILGVAARDPNVDAVLVIATMVTGERGRRTLEAVVRAWNTARADGRVLPWVMAYTTPEALAPEAHALAERAGLALYETPRRAAMALGALLRARRTEREGPVVLVVEPIVPSLGRPPSIQGRQADGEP